jgi:hypothetical protein
MGEQLFPILETDRPFKCETSKEKRDYVLIIDESVVNSK